MKKWILLLLFFHLFFLSGCESTDPRPMPKPMKQHSQYVPPVINPNKSRVPGFPPGHELNPEPNENPPMEDQGIQPFSSPNQLNEDRF